MTDTIHSDHYIITPSMALEIDLHDMEVLLENMKRNASRPSSMAVIRENKDQIYRIARVAAELVQAVNMREVGHGR